MPPVHESSAHVGQPPPSPHEGPLPLTPLDAGGANRPPAARIARTDRNCKFAAVLGGGAGPDGEAAARAGQAAGHWSPARPLAPQFDASARRALAGPASAVEAPHRLLLGDSPGRDVAWLRIEGGRFAGTEIHLTLSGSQVEVCVLTPHEASRQTLAIAMEAVRNRLRSRGLTMVDAARSTEHGSRPDVGEGPGGRTVRSRGERHDGSTF